MKIAVCGKGGVGKTTLTAALVWLVAGRGTVVYAIDADPDANLGLAIGIPEDDLATIRSLADLEKVIKSRTGAGGGLFTLNPKVDDILDTLCYHLGRVRFLRMGNVKRGGTGCYCREYAFLNAVVTSLLLDKTDAVILDMAAGIEHLTRGASRGMDALLVVVEPTRAAVDTARNLAALAADLAIPRVFFVGNKSTGIADDDFLRQALDVAPLIGSIRLDPGVLYRSDTASAWRGNTPAGAEDVLRVLLDHLQWPAGPVTGACGSPARLTRSRDKAAR
ncbi:MAG: AAA family ATPase [Bacillota bacterium]|nr:AAA family ATPase [Bacillota bacterium]